jgi:CHAT domain-containing protein/tetratricopeptide (TPR) repeat protein
MAGGWMVRPLMAIVLAGFVWSIALAGAAHAQVEDDLARLLALVGRLHGQGRFAEAVPVAKRAVALARKQYGEEHEEFAVSIAWLASVYRAQRRFSEAEQLYKRSLAIAEKALGPLHPEIGTALRNLAHVYVEQGRPGEAEPHLKRSLAIRQKALGRDHPDVGAALISLAGVYRVQGRYAEAEPLLKRNVAIYMKARGPNHPDVAMALHILARLYAAQHRHGEAEPLYKRSLGIREKALGADHPDVGTSLNDLAIVVNAQGRYGEVETLYKRSLAIAEKTAGPEHTEVGTVLYNLAGVYAAQGRYGEAEPLLKRSLAIAEKALGRDHLVVGNALNNLAGLYADQSRYNEAEPLYKRSLTIVEKTVGRDHSDFGIALNGLAELYRVQGRYREAEPLYRRSLSILERTPGPHRPDVGEVLNNLALLYIAQGHYDDAELLLKRSLAIAETVVGAAHPNVGTPLNNLANLYERQARYAEAEPLYKRGLAIAEQAFGPSHPFVATLLNNFGGLYTVQGRYGEAQVPFARSLTIREQVLGRDHFEVGASLNNIAVLAYLQSDWARAADYWQRSTDLTKRRTERSLAAGRGQAPQEEAHRLTSEFRGLIKANFRIAGQVPRMPTLASELFEVAQWALSSEAAASLAKMAARSASGSPQLANIVRERQDLVGEWQVKDKLLVAAKSELPEKRKAAAEKVLSDRLTAIDTRLAEIERQLAQEFPDHTALESPASVFVGDAQGQLGTDEVLVLFLDTSKWGPLPEETFIWILTRTEVLLVRSDLGTAALTREVAALRCGLDAAAWNSDGAERCFKALGIPSVAGVPSPLPFDHARSHKLYMGLFGEVQDLIRGKHLLIVPSGPLTQLPFHLLVTQPPASGDHRAAAWLAREHAVTVLPAVTSLKALRRVARPSTAARPIIGFGNPLVDGPDGRYADRAKIAREKRNCEENRPQRIVHLDSRGGLAVVDTRGGLADLAHLRTQTPLPETADELCAVAQYLKAETRDIRLGTAATEREVKRLNANGELARYRMIHFATHGALAGELDGTHEPGLILTPPEKASEEDDGYLSASEIASLKLDADWVVLSACNTAAGGATNAEALSGLGRAFIYAGARSLLVSHWSVYSDATVKLITGAVGEIARDARVGRAEAMRRSMLALIDKGSQEEAHPAFWAPFVVVGEGAAGRSSGTAMP